MKKKIIVLKGVNNSGKTTAIRNVLKEVFKIMIYRPERGDVELLFKHKDKSIAVISEGDNLDDIVGFFKKIKQDFDILICACRSERSSTFPFYYNKKEEYEVTFIDKKETTDEEREEVTKKIKELVSKYING